MSYTFDLIGVTPTLTFFNYQQQVEQHPQRSQAYLGSYECTLDAFIRSTEMLPNKPEWEWDEMIKTIVNFWLKQVEIVQYWKNELEATGDDNLLIARVANLQLLRKELESLWEL
jgi:hypothetical protein